MLEVKTKYPGCWVTTWHVTDARGVFEDLLEGVCTQAAYDACLQALEDLNALASGRYPEQWGSNRNLEVCQYLRWGVCSMVCALLLQNPANSRSLIVKVFESMGALMGRRGVFIAPAGDFTGNHLALRIEFLETFITHVLGKEVK